MNLISIPLSHCKTNSIQNKKNNGYNSTNVNKFSGQDSGPISDPSFHIKSQARNKHVSHGKKLLEKRKYIFNKKF